MACHTPFHRYKGEKGVEGDRVGLGHTWGTPVACRPFPDVAQRAHPAQGDAGEYVISVPLFHEVGEGPFVTVRPGGAMPHDQRKCSDMCRPRDVASRNRLAASFQNAVVAGAKFIGVVALVGA